jgi:hypothetical protein
MRVQDSSIEVDNQVVKHQGNHREHRLSGPEVVHIKALKPIALLKILDHILIVSTGAVGSPDLLRCCLRVIGNHDTESVLAPVFQVLKEARLLAQGLGAMGNRLPHHHVSPRLCPLVITVLKGELPYLNPFRYRVPSLHSQDLALNRGGNRHSNDIGEPILLKILDELNLIKAAVAQDPGNMKDVSKHHACLAKEAHRTLPCAGIPGAVPYVDYIAGSDEGEQRMM